MASHSSVIIPTSIPELKKFLTARGIDHSGCLEKSELYELAEKSVMDPFAELPRIKLPYPLIKLLGTTLTNHNGDVIQTESLAGKYVGLYFSAHWCPPCRQFTPHLAQIYKTLQASHPGQFEIVFISSDRDKAGFDGYYSQMPWLTIPYDERSRAAKIGSDLRVNGIPCLKLYDGNGVLYEGDGVQELMSDPAGFPWKD